MSLQQPVLAPEPPPTESRGAAASLVARARTFVIDWMPVAFILFAYDAIHNALGRFLPAPHTFPQLHLDEALFGGTVPTLTLQRALYSPAHPQWWDWLALLVYTSHFFAPVLVGLALWCFRRRRFRTFRTWLVVLTTLGYVTYALYPAVPPWLASQYGALAPTHRIVRELWSYLGREDIARLFAGTNLYANDIAAIPSLHAAYPLLLTLFFWRDSGALVRAVLVAYTLAMAFVLVYCAEHYGLDIALGWIYAIATVAVLQRGASRFRVRGVVGRASEPRS